MPITDLSIISICVAVVVVLAPSAWRGRVIAGKFRGLEASVNETRQDVSQTRKIAESLDKQLNQVPAETPTIRQHLENLDSKVDGLGTEMASTNRRLGALEKQIGTS